MSNLNKLFHKINSFYHTALADYKLSKIAAPSGLWDDEEDGGDEDAPDTDPMGGGGGGGNELYNNVLRVASAVRDPDIASEAILIATMYKKALELNDGFNTVKKAVSVALNLLDVDDPDDEEDPVNQLIDALGEISADAAKKAKENGSAVKGDSEAAVKAIRQAQDDHNREEREKELSGQNRSTSDLSDYDESAKGVFDMSGGVGMEQAGQGFGRGHSTGQRTYKDWINAYETEKQRYMNELAEEQNPKIADRKKNIIANLDKLRSLIATKQMLEEKLQDVEDPENREKFNKVESLIKETRKAVTADKGAIRNDMLMRQSDELLKEYQNPRLLPKEKLILQNKLLLIKLMRSPDKNKGSELKARKLLLNFLPGMSASELGKAQFDKMMANIADAAKQKVSAEEFWRQQGDILYEMKRTGDFAGAFRQLKQHPSNIRSGDQKEVLDTWRERMIEQATVEEHTHFGPLLSTIAEVRKGLPTNYSITKLKALPEMKVLLKALQEKVKLFEEKAKLMKWRLEKLNESVKTIEAWSKKVEEMSKKNDVFTRHGLKADITAIDFKPKLSFEEVQKAKTLLAEITALSKQSYPDPFSGAERQNTKRYLENVVAQMTLAIMGSGKGDQTAEWMKHKAPEKEKVAPAPKVTRRRGPNPENLVERTDPETSEIVYIDKTDGQIYSKDEAGNYIKYSSLAVKLRMQKLASILRNK